ncbi:carnitine dehydratase [Afipia sp. P52-10]|uniref:CaiB/BaiF CoA transferase family protein n=1 Tax=Afipia sp. P52-10 TaxID=1429916 RepID=UPI0003DF1D2A|nr:CaiB/BaiF CoA-transferase family protein [Afipia sp. P52-10]ETR76104.1 carnitine dehydratase [Afipia sp. P52-10]
MSKNTVASGPLSGVRIIEFAGIGPGPYASMMLSDMGADVVTITRIGQWKSDPNAYVNRGRRVVEFDLKNKEHVSQALDLIASADALIEGFRPQVMERLGLGPDVALKRNPRLIYGRMTGWGQEGPLAMAAGHDINYIAITGALDSFRSRQGDPVSPLNLIGDFGGGALFLVVGLLAGIIEARQSGKGQVVDVAMCDGVTNMLTMFHAQKAMGRWTEQVGTNTLDGGAHFYRPYKCACGNYMSIGAIEPQFYAELRRITGMTDPAFDDQLNRSKWPELHQKLEAIFLTKTRDEWTKLLEGTDACAAPIVGLFDAPEHPHLKARKTFVEHDGRVQPAPAPRFSRTPSAIQHGPDVKPMPAAEVLDGWAEKPALRSRA